MADTKFAVMNPGKHHLGYSFDFPPYQNTRFLRDKLIKEMRFKTAVMMNRRAYVGNVKYTLYDGSVETLSDSIFKSKTNNFDAFTTDRRIDVAVGDGEDIIRLAGYADRLLQFKQNTLHIINVSGASEFLEDVYKFKGVNNPASVCETDFGIAWGNSYGAYLFDGRRIVNLLERDNLRKISPTQWDTIGASDTIYVGYIPKERQILFTDEVGDVMLYDVVTKSWTHTPNRLDADNKTNLVNTWDGSLVFGQKDGGTGDTQTFSVFKYEVEPPSTTGSKFFLQTKDLDFGEPATAKKIKKVYITHKNSGDEAVFNYYKDGTTTTGSNVTLTDSAQWLRQEIPISESLYSIKLAVQGTGSLDKDFEINDISIVFREKTRK